MRTWIIVVGIFVFAGAAFAAESPQPEKGKEVETKKESARPALSKKQVEDLKALGLSTEKFMQFSIQKKEEVKR